jgi:type II secretion system protein J
MFRSNKAFTLIEVLVGLMIFALISVSLYNSFHMALEFKKRGIDANRVYREARWVMAKLEGDLENVIWYDFSGSYGNKTSFLGDHHKVCFVIHTSEGLKVVWYYLKSNNSSTKLLCRKVCDFKHFLESNQKDLEKETDQEVVLSDAVSGLEFFYSQKNGGDWENTWDNEKDIPGAVKADLILQAQGGPHPVLFERKIFIPLGRQVFRTQPF